MLETALRLMWITDENGVRHHPRGYGDPAYTQSDVIFRKAKGIRSTPEKKVDKSMQDARAGVEDMFNTLGQVFPYFTNKCNFHILTRGRIGPAQELVAGTILLNCVTCVNGCQATGLYKLDPPTLAEYFENANKGLYVDYVNA